jgi:hypothetical protein
VCAANERVDPGIQLGEIERLGQVVVGAGIEALDARIDLAARRENEHRHRCSTPSQAPQDLETVDTRQSEIEDHQVIGLREKHVIGVGTVVHAVHRVARLSQSFLEPIGEARVVLG